MDRYVGLDAHAETCTLAVMGPTGKRLTSRVVETNGHTLLEAIRGIPGRIHLCLEEGTQSSWLYEILEPQVSEIVVAVPEESMIFLGRVDESEVGKLRHGMTLILTIGAIEGHRPEAILEHIAPKGVEKDGAIQFEIKAAIKPMKDVIVRADYSSNADIVLDRRDDVLAVSESLLTFEDGKKYVDVETAPQTFARREVQTGLSDGLRIEIVSGLTETDKVKGTPEKARTGTQP